MSAESLEMDLFLNCLGIEFGLSDSATYFSKTLIGNTLDGMFSYDQHFRVILWNKAIENITGYTEKEILGKNLLEVFPFFVKTGVVSAFTKALNNEGGQISDADFYIPEKGKLGYYYATIFPVKSPKGEAIAGMCIFHENTKRKEAENKLAEQVLFTEKVIQTLPHYIYVYDLLTKKVVYYNKRVEELLGFPLIDDNSFGARLVEEVIHPEDTLRAMEQYLRMQTAKEGEVVEVELRLLNARKEWRWICNSGTVFKRTQQGEPWHVIFTFEDITEKKRNQMLLSNIVTHSPNAINVYKAVRDAKNEIIDFEYVLINKASEKMLHRKHDELLGKWMMQTFPGTREAVFDLWKRTVETGETFEQEQWYDSEDFSNWFRLSGLKLDDGLVVTIEDITNRKEAEKQMQEHRNFIQQVSNSLPNVIVCVNDVLKQENIFTNKNIVDVLGLSAELFERKSVASLMALIHPDDVPAVQAKLEKLMLAADEEVHQVDYRLRDGKGAYRFIRSKSSVFQRTPNGEVWQTINLLEDITSQKISEQKLIQQETLRKETEALAKMGSWEWDLVTREIVWSEELYRIFGLKKEDSLHFEEINRQVLPEDFPVIERLMQQLGQTPNTPFYYEYRIKTPQHEVRYLAGEASSEADEEGNAVKYKGYVRDISQEKGLQNLVNKIIDSSLDGIVAAEAVRDEQGNIIDFRYQLINFRGEQILGATASGIVGSFMLSVYPHLQSEGVFDQYVRVAETGVPTDIELFYPYDGLNQWFRIVVVRLGEGIVITFSDITRQKLNELQIVENEASLLEIQALAHLGHFELDMQTKQVKWSEEWRQIYEVSSELDQDIHSALKYVHPADLPSVTGMLDSFITEPKETSFETRIVTGKQVVKFIRGKLKPIFNEQGALVKAVGYSQDITEMKRVEWELSNTLAQLKDVQKLANMGNWSLDLTTQLYTWSDECCRMLGLSQGTRLSLSESNQFIHPEDAAKVVEKIQNALAQKTSFISEHRVVRPDGSICWIHVYGNLVFDAHQQVIGLAGVGQDITEAKSNVLAMEKLNYQHDLILSSIEEGILGLDAVGNSMFMNRKAAELTGFSIAEMLGHQQHQLIHHTRKDGSAYPLDECPIMRVIKTGVTEWRDDEVFWRKDGSSFPVEYIAKPVLEHNVISGIVVTFKDITEKKLAQKKLQLAYEQLEQAKGVLETINNELEKKVEERMLELNRKNEELTRVNIDLDNFIYTASHDLKAPINNIEGLVKILNKSTTNDDRTRKVLDMIVHSIDRFKNTIKDLTEISKIQNLKSDELETLSVEALLQDIKEDIQDLITFHEPILLEELAVKEIRFSRKNLRSILFNLVSNAIKYRSPERTPVVTIATGQVDQDFIFISVADNGLGIRESDQAKAFSMFKRLHNHVEGSGVGLYLLKRIVENTGGRIELESEVGKGSTFKVYLKRMTEPQSE